MRSPVEPKTEASILARLILTAGEISPGAAEYLLSIRFEDADIDRINALSELAREGKLSPTEEAELDGYIHIDNLLAVVQSKARSALQSSVLKS